MTNEEVERLSRDLSSWLESAVGDVAYSNCGDNFPEVDLMADELFNDPDTLQDLLGYPIYDAGKEYPVMIRIAEKMKETAHQALVTALDELIWRWRNAKYYYVFVWQEQQTDEAFMTENDAETRNSVLGVADGRWIKKAQFELLKYV